MSSGIYSALSGAKARMEVLDTISHNMANMKTSGFKKGRTVFEAVLSEAQSGNGTTGVNFTKLHEGFSDFSSGLITGTDQPFDMAISGEGFFKVRDEQGNFFYTRQGNFNPNAEGNLVAAGGFKLLAEGGEPIIVEGSNVTIDEDGTIRTASGTSQKIPLYQVADETQLERISGSLFALKGSEATLMENPKVLQGSIEESNVNIMQEMARMVEAMRVFETSQRAIKTYDNLAAKVNELGTLG
jgi:flagellar basal-body rod protein FlgF